MKEFKIKCKKNKWYKETDKKDRMNEKWTTNERLNENNE